MDAIALCYFWGNMKKKLIFKSFKQIYVLSVTKQKLEKKPRTRPYFTKCTVTTNQKESFSLRH